jgi:hypothetical protein
MTNLMAKNDSTEMTSMTLSTIIVITKPFI